MAKHLISEEKVEKHCSVKLLCLLLRNDINRILESTDGEVGTKFLKIVVKLGNYFFNNSMEPIFNGINLYSHISDNCNLLGKNCNIQAITLRRPFLNFT